MSVEVKKIEIKIDDKVIELTPGQARELKCILNDMYQGSYVPYWPPIVIERERPYVPDYPYRYWGAPTTSDVPKIWCDNRTTCVDKGTGGTLMLSANSTA